MKQRVVIAGGSGFIGQHLSERLIAAGYDVVILSRSAKPAGAVRSVQWDGKTLRPWAAEIDGASAVINLAGKSINCRHTNNNRREILRSRVDSVRLLGEAIGRAQTPPPVFVQTSAVGIYGDAGSQICAESSRHGIDYVAEVCDKWEAAFEAIDAPALRKVTLRLGVVLGRDGGFLRVMTRLTRCYLGGAAGDGRQFITWVHTKDLCGMFLAAIEYPEVTGIYNACAPDPVMNQDFMSAMRAALHRPWSPPIPAFAVRLGSWLIGTEGKLALVSQRVLPEHFLMQDFPFQFPTLMPALKDLLNSPSQATGTSG
jgi:uncharacterized protein (TIGR01777 family)